MRLAVFHNLDSGGSPRALRYQIKYLKKFGHAAKIYSLKTPTVYYCNEPKRDLWENGKPMILSVGTFLPHKGFAFLIRSVSLIPAPHRPILVLAGNGGSPGYILHLKSLSRSLDVNLTIHRSVADAKLIKLYQKSAVFAAPFYNEPFGLVV